MKGNYQCLNNVFNIDNFILFISSIFSGFLEEKIGIKGSHLITCSSIIITTVLSILIFLEVGLTIYLYNKYS